MSNIDNINIVMTTANGKYKYNDKLPIKNIPIDHVVQSCHKYNSLACNWKIIQLNPGTYGYDNLIMSIMTVIDEIIKDNQIIYSKLDDLEYISSLVHYGWSLNYIYWRDEEPYLKSKLYKKPVKPFNDPRRNKLSLTLYDQLPEEEKKQNQNIALFIQYVLKN